MMKQFQRRRREGDSGEFVWLVSLGDLMILMFIFFVVMFSFTYKKLTENDVKQIVAALKDEPPPVSPVAQIRNNFASWIKEQNLEKQVQVNHTSEAVTLEIKDQVLFSSGDFKLHTGGTHVMQELAKVLEKIPEPYRIGIEGHTDDTPIHTKKIQDNWDLASKRALSVLYNLNLSQRALKRTSLISRGQMEPLAPNRDAKGKNIPENQSKNRRVTIRIF